MTIETIDKEMLHSISFKNEDVLSSPNDRLVRQWKLERALKLGNLFKHHVKVIFESSDGQRLQTVATVWALTEKFIHLKGGRVIPIHQIIDIQEC